MSLASIAEALAKKKAEAESEAPTANRAPTAEELEEAANALNAFVSSAMQSMPQNNYQVQSNAQSPAVINMDKIKASIKAERVALGWSQRDLASKSGMSQGTITRAEKYGWISIWALLRITNALGKEIALQ